VQHQRAAGRHRDDGHGGGSSLQYDSTADQYTNAWKTASSSAGTCVQFDLGRNDGNTHTFLVEFKK
jgi:uncharacterized membrane protein